MFIERIGRLCAVLVLSGVSSISLSQTLNFGDAIQLAIENGVITIPETYTNIGSNAFYGITAETVIIPEGITSIGNNAFSYSNIEYLNLPESVNYIYQEAFHHSSIKSINLSPNLIRIDRWAFANSQLEEINFPDGIIIDEHAFTGTKIQHLVIPDNAEIGSEAFSSMSLKSIELGANLSADGYGGSSSHIFTGSTSELKTVIINGPGQFGCSNNNYPYGICFTDPFDPEYVVLRSGARLRFKISTTNTTIVSSESFSLTNNEGDIPAKKVVLVEPVTLTDPFTAAPHEVCQNIDTDSDGHQDCYDQFPNDPDRWFDYSDTNQTNITELVHSDDDGLADIFDRYPTSNNYPSSNDWDNSETTIDTDGDNIHNAQDIDDDDDGLLDIYEPFFGTNPLIPDSDFDGTLDGLDAFPLDNTESLDTDSDGIGNNADTDDDNDGYTDFLDAFPTDATEWADSDSDGIGNNSDLDDDNDGVADTEDAFPHTASESLDSDNDGVGDIADAFPNDATEVADNDLDGIGNNADPDDDNDGVADGDDGDPLNADIGIQPSQLISVAGNPVGVNGHSTRISLSYDTSDGNNQLPGVGFRIHFNSEMLTYNQDPNNCMNGYDHDEGHEEEDDHDHGFDFHGFCGFEYGSEEDEIYGHEDEEERNLRYVYNSLVVNGDGPYQDDSNFDNDSSTDKFIIFGWAALVGDFPNVSLPTGLLDVVFNVSWDAFDQASITTPINFSKVSTTEGYNFDATNYTLNVLPATWDFDGNGQADALTDGLILLRHAFGVRGASLTDSVMATDSTMTPEEVQVAVEKALVIADIDGSGSVDALTDGLILLRYMFGLTGETLMDSVVSANATRASVESIQQYIELYMPNNLSPPVQSEPSFIVGDWKLAGVPDKREYEEGALQDWNFYGSAYSQAKFDNCVADDIYRFGENGTFEYLINGSTYIDDELNPLYDWNDFTSSSCVSPLAPWNEDQIYTYSIDQNNSLLTVNGYGAYIALAHVANGTDDIENAADAPESISYDFTRLSDTEVLLEIDAYDDFYRFTLERVLDN
jgi:hypothetical protein